MSLLNSGDKDPAQLASNRPPRDAEEVVKFPKLVAFDELCPSGDEVWIENEGQIYRLRRTKLGKLILTK